MLLAHGNVHSPRAGACLSSLRELIPHPSLCPKVRPGGRPTHFHLRSLPAGPICEQDREESYFGLSPLAQVDDCPRALVAAPLRSRAEEHEVRPRHGGLREHGCRSWEVAVVGQGGPSLSRRQSWGASWGHDPSHAGVSANVGPLQSCKHPGQRCPQVASRPRLLFRSTSRAQRSP